VHSAFTCLAFLILNYFAFSLPRSSEAGDGTELHSGALFVSRPPLPPDWRGYYWRIWKLRLCNLCLLFVSFAVKLYLLDCFPYSLTDPKCIWWRDVCPVAFSIDFPLAIRGREVAAQSRRSLLITHQFGIISWWTLCHLHFQKMGHLYPVKIIYRIPKYSLSWQFSGVFFVYLKSLLHIFCFRGRKWWVLSKYRVSPNFFDGY
jgi:hypothetical protein